MHDLCVRGYLFAGADPHEITEHDIVVWMPMPVLMMMIRPNTASFHEPVISTMTMAAKMMPLNRVNTLARTMSTREREVDALTVLSSPLFLRVITSPCVSPVSSMGGIVRLSLIIARLPSQSRFLVNFL